MEIKNTVAIQRDTTQSTGEDACGCRLGKPVSQHVRPVCLPAPDEPYGPGLANPCIIGLIDGTLHFGTTVLHEFLNFIPD